MSEAWYSEQSDPDGVWELIATAKGNHAFDVGANGGATAVMLAANFGVVDAFEPAWESYQHLCMHVPSNVVCHLMALSSHSGEVTLEETPVTQRWGELVTGHSLDFSWGEHTGTRKVPCLTLTAAAAHYGEPDFVKIDTEGHERAIVEGGMELLEDAHPNLLIEVHSADNGEVIRRLLPTYEWTRIFHSSYGMANPARLNHYYLVGT